LNSSLNESVIEIVFLKWFLFGNVSK
jgi:hypothetical protein